MSIEQRKLVDVANHHNFEARPTNCNAVIVVIPWSNVFTGEIGDDEFTVKNMGEMREVLGY
jgi:hypothetical protein